MKKNKNVKKISIILTVIILFLAILITTVLALSPNDNSFTMDFYTMGRSKNIFCNNKKAHMLVNGTAVTWNYTRTSGPKNYSNNKIA